MMGLGCALCPHGQGYRVRYEATFDQRSVDQRQAPFLMQHTKEELFQMCREGRIPFAPVHTMEEVVRHPHLRARGYFVEVSREDTGPLTYPGAPHTTDGGEEKHQRPGPESTVPRR